MEEKVALKPYQLPLSSGHNFLLSACRLYAENLPYMVLKDINIYGLCELYS
jgi:hypothetical protein